MTVSWQARRVFVFSHPRTACHVFFQLLATHPIFQVVTPFCCAGANEVSTEAQAVRSRQEWQDLLSMSDEDASKITWQGSIDGLQREVAEAELNGKFALTMDHPSFLIASSQLQAHLGIRGCEAKPTPVIIDRKLDVGAVYPHLDAGITPEAHPNPTLLPDRFFFSFTPIITIRHPARVLPSFLRALQRLGDDISHPEFAVHGESFRLERLIFDSFKAYEEARAVAEGRKAKVPIVIDGDKLVRDPQDQMKELCMLLGIDEGQLKYSWDPPRLLEHTKMARAYMDEFNRSTGIFFNPRAKEVNMAEEVRCWRKEWNEDIARILEEKVAAQMEDYEYLLQFSL
ncbi:hypothetical protein E1B28_003466 [Marasmius oreades]|uniref:Sulfotransferase n=1 Tax=Marasmius oreades TaxID=181124 RepID=A0A9P7UMH2_9AGAR|nr:uncharacterized protein E1B28_003451 [Marasmius oreades]XP_043002407.1 uncharacterized protein E1B28_003466 [Marasmius oreades]KAG7085919.1 hypothetical protein E1B28_003451 [Marasmius oreades]KAG7085936.1 hypothetical protein E1B28_003466 [Marasmius oreades]